MRPFLLFGDYDQLIADLADAARTDTTRLARNVETIMAQIDDLSAAAQDISDKAAQNRAAVDEAVALIKQLGVEDPRLDEVLASLAESSAELDDATTDLAAADDPPADPVDPEDPPVEPPA